MDLSSCQGALSVPLEALSSPWALHQWLQDQLLYWQVRPFDPFDKPVSCFDAAQAEECSSSLENARLIEDLKYKAFGVSSLISQSCPGCLGCLGCPCIMSFHEYFGAADTLILQDHFELLKSKGSLAHRFHGHPRAVDESKARFACHSLLMQQHSSILQSLRGTTFNQPRVYRVFFKIYNAGDQEREGYSVGFLLAACRTSHFVSFAMDK